MAQSYHSEFAQTRTFDIIEASKFLGAHKETIRRMAATGQLPAVKIGRAWRFIEQDLMVHMRSQYHSSNEIVEHHDYRINKGWQSKREMTSGGLTSHIKESEYAKALGLK
jgi:excisionase family DNA binding protein